MQLTDSNGNIYGINGLEITSIDGKPKVLAGVTQIIAGANIVISPVGGTGVVTISSTGSSGTTSNVLIDGGTFLAPTENTLIDAGTFI